MTSSLPDIRVQPAAAGGSALSRRSFLRYTGASAALGSLWLASCTKKEDITPAPAVASLSPASGMVGATITLTGTGLTGATAVTLAGTAVAFVVAGPTTLTFMVPAGAQTGTVAVTTPAGTGTSAGPFTVLPTPASAPTVVSFSPATAPAGTVITLTGTNFTGATSVMLGTTAATFTVVNATTLTFTVPAAAQTGTVAVTTPAGTGVSSAAFIVVSTAPAIASFTPASAYPGTTVTVTGTYFTGATAVTVAGLPATSFVVVSATTLTLVVPAPAASLSSTPQAGAISITAPGGVGSSAALATGGTFTILPTTVSVGTGDVGVLNYAYALEQLEAAFYTQVRTSAYYTGAVITGAEKQVFEDLYYHEVIHREFFKASITATGLAVLKDLTPDFSTINFSDRTSVLNTAKAFEDLGSAAYVGAGQYITSPAYLYLVGKIASVEARHAALIRDLVSENTFVGNDVVTLTTAGSSSVSTNNGPAGSSLERALAPAEVAAVANTYLAPGSKLDVSGIG